MKFKLTNNFLNKLALVIVPILILSWLIMSLLFQNRVSLSVLTYQTKNLAHANNIKTNLYKGEIYRGEFIARDNNLGMIILKLDNYKKSKFENEDVLVFRFKEKDKNSWNYTAKYSSSLFDSQVYFPFGISAIPNSKGKIYQFELLSTKGDFNNPIKIKSLQTFITGYQYSKQEILGGGLGPIKFIYNKFYGFITDVDLLFNSLIYLIPLMAFITLRLLLRMVPVKAKQITMSFSSKYIKILFMLILLKIILPKDTNFDAYLIALGVWIYAVINFKLKNNISFILSLILLIFWITIIPFGFKTLQVNLNIFIYMFFATGCLQLFYEEVKFIRK